MKRGILLLSLAAIGFVWLMWSIASGLDERERESLDYIRQRRETSADAKACRGRNGFPVWGDGWSADRTEMVECRAFPTDSKR